jgi:hypothetical protein
MHQAYDRGVYHTETLALVNWTKIMNDKIRISKLSSLIKSLIRQKVKKFVGREKALKN